MERTACTSLLHVVLDSANDAIQIVDAATLCVVDANVTTCRVLGYSRDELQGMPISQIDSSIVPSRVDATLQLLRATGAVRWEGLHRCKNGDTFPVEVRLSMVVADGRELIVSVARDISARRYAETRDVRLTAALEQAAETVVITDAAGMIVYVNSAFEQVSGFGRGDLIGKNPRVFKSGMHARQFYETMWQALTAGETWMATFKNRRKDGTPFELNTTISPVRDPTGRITSYIAVGRDLRKELRLERRLQDAARQLQTLVDASPVGILSYAANGDAISANAAAARIVGGTIEQLCSQNFHSLASWKHTGLLDAAVAAIETDCEQVRATSGVSSFGHTVHLDARFVPFDFDGERQLLVLLRDITDEKQLAEQLARSQKIEAIGRLAGGVAHDFNNILAVIMSFAEFVREALPVNDPSLDDLAEIQKAADRAAGLTKQLLVFSQHMPTQKVALNLSETVGQLQKFLKRAVGESIELVVKTPPQPVVVTIDAVQFEQVLLNLALNARDAMPDGGRITIAVEASGAKPHCTARITVTDTGVGMSEEVKAHIFEPFYTTKTQGTGLGLATCARIVADAGGEITVSSRMGGGTTFRIDLPLASESSWTKRDERPLSVDGRGQTVLVAEDDAAVRRASVRALEAANYHVVQAVDGEEAIRYVDELGRGIDLVISDSAMPGCSGESVLRYCERQQPGIATLLMSGYVDGSASAREILCKPVSPAALVRAAASAIKGAHRDSPVSSPAGTERPGPVPQHDRSNPRVLLVEDNPVVAAPMRRTMEASDIVVTTAECLAAARAQTASRRFDVLVVDVRLPDGRGFDLLSELRDHSDHTPVVIITGERSTEDAAEAVHCHAYEYLEKPVSPGHLRQVIRSAAYEARSARLRDGILRAHGGSHEFLRDLADAERTFASALGQIEMVYQPIVRGDGSVFAYEALLRSGEPALATPDRLIAAAEALDRIDDLGRGVRAAVATAIESDAHRTELFFVNVHPRELDHGAIVAVSDPLLPHASRVVLEVIERSSLTSSPDLAGTLGAIRERGYRLAIDDLGEGYAALSSLVRLHPEFVKIDMSLVRNIHQCPANEPIVKAIVSLAHGTGIEVVAEGIETSEECEVLRRLGCDLFQGYLFGRPKPLA